LGIGLPFTTVTGDVRGRTLMAIHPRSVAVHRSSPGGSPVTFYPSRSWLTGRVPLVAELTPAAVEELGLEQGGAVFAAVKATGIDVSTPPESADA